jgi:uncharacterized protein (TIGR02453 family)
MNFKGTLDFLKKLEKNNNKEWFEANRKSYEEAKKNLLEFTEMTIKEISRFDENIKGLEAKNCIFRINKDIRFSKDKTPYKNNMGALISKDGRKSMLAGYYLHIEPGGSFLAGGCWMPEPDKLQSVRQEIDYNLKDFEKVMKSADVKKYFGELKGEKLKTVPKGYAADNPAIDYLKHKSFILDHYVDDKQVAADDFPAYAVKVFKAMHPLNVFLNEAMAVAR